MKKAICHDCAVEEGQLHQEGCDMERCPMCKNGQQLLSCTKHTWGDFPDDIREPYFFSGFSCKRCGEFFPEMFMVSDEEWKMICGLTYEKEDVLCKPCMDFILKERRRNGQMLEMSN